jgi:predicted dehydrogenase/threonine dehydrogenase-like Zn-dependent dehydrogenase
MEAMFLDGPRVKERGVKQVLINRGKIILGDVPAPVIQKGHILVAVAYSLISTGTEVTTLENSGKPIYRKALEQDDSVSKFLSYLKQNGWQRTLTKVLHGDEFNYLQTGYSCSGTVVAVGEDINDIQVGEKVACSGSGIANHAEFVLAPRNLVTKVPTGCNLRDAASVTLGGIALQGVRRAETHIGDIVAVIGLGLLGQLTVQLLKAGGNQVIGIDLDEKRASKAAQLGADLSFVSGQSNILDEARNITSTHGVDATIITAASTSDAIIQQAMEITRKKGKVVIVGAVGLNIKRSPFYEKEIDLLMSCSYGPGRYDDVYERSGIDYPYAYVRWTENRNMVEYLRLIARGSIKIDPLLEKEYRIEEARNAFVDLTSGHDKPLGIVLRYDHVTEIEKQVNTHPKTTLVINHGNGSKTGRINVAIVGAGGFATRVHLPNLRSLNQYYTIKAVVSSRGVNARSIAEAYQADYATTNYQDVLEDGDIDMVLIATRHNQHAAMAMQAALAGKAIFLEKPMAVDQIELEQLASVLEKTRVPFSVGFNRRYSPTALQLQSVLLNRKNSMMVNYRVNAGYVPFDHWTQTAEGGGRIIGEACHMIDLFRYFIGPSRIDEINVIPICPQNSNFSSSDNLATSLRYEDGSICTLFYTALGNPGLSKEYIEVYFDGKVAVIDDFKSLRFYGLSTNPRESKLQDKGHRAELLAFAQTLKGEKESPVPLNDLIETTQISFKVASFAKDAARLEHA